MQLFIEEYKHDFFSFCSDTSLQSSYSMQLFIKEYTTVSFILTVRCNRSFDTVPLNRRIYRGLLLKNINWFFLHSDKRLDGNRFFFPDGLIPLVECEQMDQWSSV
jgi:hypothetical protein